MAVMSVGLSIYFVFILVLGHVKLFELAGLGVRVIAWLIALRSPETFIVRAHDIITQNLDEVNALLKANERMLALTEEAVREIKKP